MNTFPRRAFTLVELLVVIGIIAILLGILLPVFSRAMESSRQTQCMSNCRQLTFALILYAKDNRDSFPFSAQTGDQQVEDWIWYQPNRDINGSAIASYIEGFHRQLLICPSDDVNYRPRILDAPYRYSYSINMLCAGNPKYSRTAIRYSTITYPEERMLMMEESEDSIDDGNFNPLIVGSSLENRLSARHDRPERKTSADANLRGNVSFLDSHCEFVTRTLTRTPANYDPLAPP